MRTFRPPVEVHGVAVLAVHGHGAELLQDAGEAVYGNSA